MNQLARNSRQEKAEARQNAPADTKRRNSASCRTAASREPPPKRPHKKYNNPTYSISDYETENTHTAGSRTDWSERLPKLDRQIEGIPPLFKTYVQEGGTARTSARVRSRSGKSEHDLADTVCGCTCPIAAWNGRCSTRKSVFNEREYFCIITTCKQYQSDTLLLRRVPITRQGRQPVFHL